MTGAIHVVTLHISTRGTDTVYDLTPEQALGLADELFKTSEVAETEVVPDEV